MALSFLERPEPPRLVVDNDPFAPVARVSASEARAILEELEAQGIAPAIGRGMVEAMEAADEST